MFDLFKWLPAVEAVPRVAESVFTTVEGIAGDFETLAREIGFTMPPQMQSFVSQLRGKAQQIGHAVAANTPAAQEHEAAATDQAQAGQAPAESAR